MNRESNYRFSFKKMLSLSGNTAPYMLYAYARIEGIRRKAAENTQAVQGDTQDTHFALTAPEELALAKLLIKFEDVLREVEKDLYPSKVRVAAYHFNALPNALFLFSFSVMEYLFVCKHINDVWMYVCVKYLCVYVCMYVSRSATTCSTCLSGSTSSTSAVRCCGPRMPGPCNTGPPCAHSHQVREAHRWMDVCTVCMYCMYVLYGSTVRMYVLYECI